MKILIPIDGSECSKETLEWASNVLACKNVNFFLFEVVEPTLGTPVGNFEIEKVSQHLKEAKAMLENAGCQTVKVAYQTGNAPHEICEYAKEIEADQVLMGSHGRTGLSKLLLGSVSAKVLAECEQPVFIYRNTQKKRFEMMTPNKML